MTHRYKHGFRIEHRLSIYQEFVIVPPEAQGHGQEPRAIRQSPHQVRSRIPTIEIACQTHLVRVGSLVAEFDQLCGLFGPLAGGIHGWAPAGGHSFNRLAHEQSRLVSNPAAPILPEAPVSSLEKHGLPPASPSSGKD